MPSEDDLRTALAHGVASLYPDVDAELDRVLSTATRRERLRRTSYAVAVAAAVALVLMLAGHDWRPAAAPEPARETPVWDLPSGVGRYASPVDLLPGRWNVDFLPDRWPHRAEADIDVPVGWGQDDRFSLATGPGGERATRRIDFIAGKELALAWCPGQELGAERTPLDIARAISSVAAMSADAPEPVTVDGHDGWFVELGDTPARETPDCRRPDTYLYAVPGLVCQAPGFTTLMWVFDIDGRELAVFASYGPRATDQQVEEMVRMVETASYTT
ncbi:hypothetical protein [Nocardioides taihuensis]|uniref:Uncharacterized protein n=1 Tax=Nocardioides taihuensis TaxID=1835606 RepID=A0ABW0BGA4_9ACTN